MAITSSWFKELVRPSPHYLIDRMKLDGPHLAFDRETCELVHTR